jgi:hypothetical protein
VVYEVPYESSVVDPTIVSVHKQKVWDREKFAELIVLECIQQMQIERGNPYRNMADIEDFAIGAIDESIRRVKEHFGVEL